MQRGTVEYTRFGSEYFSGANVGIYFGDVLVDEIFNLQFNLQEQIIPVFGYGSYTYDAVAKGQRIINGAFNIYFKESAYLTLLMEQLENELDSRGNLKPNPFKYDKDPEEATIQRIINELNSKSSNDFDKLAELYEESIWGKDLDGKNEFEVYSKNKGKGPYFTPLSHSNLNKDGFDILIAYGPEARRQVKSLGSLEARTTVQSINNVHLTSVGTIFDSSGQAIYEQYSFIAQDLNANIHEKEEAAQDIPDSAPTLRIGSYGSEVTDVQVALNRFITFVIENDSDILVGEYTDRILVVNGHFGSEMKLTVEYFQDYYNLSIDGVVGIRTWSKLRSENFLREE